MELIGAAEAVEKQCVGAGHNGERSVISSKLPRPRTVRGILVLVMVVLLLPILGVESILHYFRFQELQAKEYQTNLELARSVANGFRGFVDDVHGQELAIGLAIANAEFQSLERASAFLAVNAESNAPVLSYSFADPAGNIRASSQPGFVGMSLADRPFFRSVLTADLPAVSDLLQDRLAPSTVFVISRLIRDGQDAVLGVVVAFVDPHHLDEHVRVDRTLGAITIVDGNGQLAYRYPDVKRHSIADQLPVDNPIVRKALNGEESFGALSPSNGVAVHALSFAPVPDIGWAVVAGRPIDQIAGPALKELLAESLLYVLLVLAAVPFAVLVSRRLTVPLGLLREHALALGRGELGRRISVTGVSELVDLGDAFNLMSKEVQFREVWLNDHVLELQQAKESLRQARDDLEARVQERTAELAASEERFRSVVQTAINAIVLVDPHGKVVFWNHAAETMFGYSPDELNGCLFRELVPEAQLSTSLESFDAELFGRHGRTFEHTAVRKDGRQFPMELSVGLLRDREGSYLTCIGRDISQRKQMNERIRETIATLQYTLERTVHAMAMAIETRDPYTAGHQRRVADIACKIAREMDLSDQQIMVIRLAATVHDIGKISVPAEILVKPGVITEWELDLIRAHARIGYEILKTIEFPWPVAEIVYQHHERLDGSGYPAKLMGEAILLEARILAVADVVEAMASDRPYRPALGEATALAEISRYSGVQYDATVVEACLKLFARGGARLVLGPGHGDKIV